MKVDGAICGGEIVLHKCKGCGKFKRDKGYKLTFDPEKIWRTMMAIRKIQPWVCSKCKKKGVRLAERDKPYFKSMI